MCTGNTSTQQPSPLTSYLDFARTQLGLGAPDCELVGTSVIVDAAAVAAAEQARAEGARTAAEQTRAEGARAECAAEGSQRAGTASGNEAGRAASDGKLPEGMGGNSWALPAHRELLRGESKMHLP